MGFLQKLLRSNPKSELVDPVVNSELTEIVTQPKPKGGFKMKHQIELKLPKFLDPMFDNLTAEEKKKFGTVALTCGAAALGVTVVYLIGYNRGIRKAIDNRGIYIVKGGD